MRRGVWAGLAVLLLALLLPATPAEAGKNLKIVSVAYDQHFNPTEDVRFTIVVKNNEATAESAEIDVTLSNIDTEAETTLTPVLTGTAGAGGTVSLSTTYRVAAGTYTVSFPLFDGDGVRVDRVAGKFPLHIGTETESIHVYPEVIQLGTLPPGRYMHPMPIEVRWNYYRFNRLRLDQPFTVRIYTDNATRYAGIPGALRRLSGGGLVSLDGRYVIPLKVWCLNFGPDIQETGWDVGLAGPPPVDEDDAWIGPPLLEGKLRATYTGSSYAPGAYAVGRNVGSASWVRIPDLTDMTANPTSWRRLIGQDPHDDRFVSDSNPTGDFTLRNPFTFWLATEAGPAAVEGSYAATLVVELWNP